MVRTILTATALSSVGVAALIFVPISLPGRGEDICRMIVVSQASLALGFLFRIFFSMLPLRFENAEKIKTFICLIFLSYFFLTVFVVAEILSVWSHNILTWRTPLAFFSFSLSDVALYKLMIQMSKVIKVADQEQAVLRLAIMDTSKPGPDLDLTGKIQNVH